GIISSVEMNHLRARLIAKIKKKVLSLPENRILSEVDDLLNQLRGAPNKLHFNAVLREGFRPAPLKRQVVVSSEHRPWRTDWALAKIVFELFNVVAPEPYKIYFRQAALTVREFLERRKYSDDGKQGLGLFRYFDLPDSQSERCHMIRILLTPQIFDWHLTFFGTAR